MPESNNIFRGCVPALMTPCRTDRTPDYATLVDKARELIAAGMNGVVYCGSMGDWPLLSDAQRQEGVRQLVDAGVPVIVGTGAVDLSRVGKLLITTGSGETNTHIQIIEGLVDRLIELGKPFDYMVYPNRDHGLREGRGSEVHVRMLILRYLLENLPSGPSAIAASLK